jgi:hypothetical protein
VFVFLVCVCVPALVLVVPALGCFDLFSLCSLFAITDPVSIIPLMTPTSVSRIKVVQARFQAVILAGTLSGFWVPGSTTSGTDDKYLNIVKVDLVPPPPVANGSIPVEEVIREPPLLLRSGVFSFKELHLSPAEPTENVTVTVVRSLSSFGVVIVEFATADGTAIGAEGHYRPVHGFLQFGQFEREKVGAQSPQMQSLNVF